jgi:succinate dehydrogenase / fumarate reductase flavoprotein subunit
VYNPGWHEALDLSPLLTCAECVALGAIARRESRGGHTREDYPTADPDFGKLNVVLRLRGDDLQLSEEPILVMPDDLRELVET